MQQVVHGTRSNCLTILQTGMKYLFYYPTHLIRYLAAFLEWSCFRPFGFVAKQKISPNLLNFGLKMFSLFLLRKQVPTLYVSDHKQQSYLGSNLQNHASFSPLLHKRTIRTWSSRMLISTCVFLTGKREARPWYSASQ